MRIFRPCWKCEFQSQTHALIYIRNTQKNFSSFYSHYKRERIKAKDKREGISFSLWAPFLALNLSGGAASYIKLPLIRHPLEQIQTLPLAFLQWLFILYHIFNFRNERLHQTIIFQGKNALPLFLCCRVQVRRKPDPFSIIIYSCSPF